MLAVLRGQADLSLTFAPSFLAQVPPAQVAAITQQLTTQYGAVQGIEGVEGSSANTGVIRVGFERAVLSMGLEVEPTAPHRIAGLVVTAVEARGSDTPQAVIQEFQALPGRASFAIARLGGPQPVLVAAHQPDQALAIGSTFKLIILAELSRQVKSGQRRWSDVVPIDRHSLPSGMMQTWPIGSPATLHTLAALMISISDNTATDILLRVAGRENVERMMTTMGMASAARNRPFLTTFEAFRLKTDGAEGLAAWRSANEPARRRLLQDRYGSGSVDLTRLTATPMAVETVEWFASANDLVRVLDWLRVNGDDTTHAIIAISGGPGAPTPGTFSYLGFKGGSEPGVLNLTYLIRNKSGVWHAVTGGWNNPAAALEDGKFVGLMSRAVTLAR